MSPLRRCPNCRKFFAAKEIDRTQVNSEVLHEGFDPSIAAPSPMMPTRNSVDKIILTFKVTYRCKSCGYQWNEYIESGVGRRMP